MRGARFVGTAGVELQERGNDCGPACLKAVLAGRGIERSLPYLRLASGTTPLGTSMHRLRVTAGRLGVDARSWTIRDGDLAVLPLPAIAFVNGDHFVVVRRFAAEGVLEVDDPAVGRLHWPLRSFRRAWAGHVLVFDPAWVPP